MIKVEYLGDVSYFDSFEEVKNYYNHEEAKNIEELQDILIDEANGMVAPKLTEI